MKTNEKCFNYNELKISSSDIDDNFKTAIENFSGLVIITEILKGSLNITRPLLLTQFEFEMNNHENNKISLKFKENLSDIPTNVFSLIYFPESKSFNSFGKNHLIINRNLEFYPKNFDFFNLKSDSVELSNSNSLISSFNSNYYICGGIIV